MGIGNWYLLSKNSSFDILKMSMEFLNWPLEKEILEIPPFVPGSQLILKRIVSGGSNPDPSCDRKCWYYRIGRTCKQMQDIENGGMLLGFKIYPEYWTNDIERLSLSFRTGEDFHFDRETLRDLNFVETVTTMRLFRDSSTYCSVNLIGRRKDRNNTISRLKEAVGVDDFILTEHDNSRRINASAEAIKLLSLKSENPYLKLGDISSRIPDFRRNDVATNWKFLSKNRLFRIAPVMDSRHTRDFRLYMIGIVNSSGINGDLRREFESILGSSGLFTVHLGMSRYWKMISSTDEASVEKKIGSLNKLRLAGKIESYNCVESFSMIDNSRNVPYGSLLVPS